MKLFIVSSAAMLANCFQGSPAVVSVTNKAYGNGGFLPYCWMFNRQIEDQFRHLALLTNPPLDVQDFIVHDPPNDNERCVVQFKVGQNSTAEDRFQVTSVNTTVEFQSNNFTLASGESGFVRISSEVFGWDYLLGKTYQSSSGPYFLNIPFTN